MKTFFLLFMLFLSGCYSEDYYIKDIQGPHKHFVRYDLNDNAGSKNHVTVSYNLIEYGEYYQNIGVINCLLCPKSVNNLVVTLEVDGVKSSKTINFDSFIVGDYASYKLISSNIQAAIFSLIYEHEQAKSKSSM